jgi:hypothetical protein
MTEHERAMTPAANWGLGVVMAVLALLGLVMASGAEDGVFYGTGLGLFLFGILFIFFQIKQNVG